VTQFLPGRFKGRRFIRDFDVLNQGRNDGLIPGSADAFLKLGFVERMSSILI